MRVHIRFVTTFILTMLLVLTSVPVGLAAPDEGMFMLDQIVGLPIKTKGAKIKASDLYNPAGGGLSDAIVRVNIGTGGHGTGEFISEKGLILTNHHVGFDALVGASTQEKDYAKNGYSSSSMETELPAKDYSVTITQRVENVTGKILDGIAATMSDSDRAKELARRVADLQKAEQAKAPKGSIVRVQSLNNGVFFYLFQTLDIKDVRVVYAPPQNIGFFGGDPDNFEWTRHTGDFTFLRAYVAPDGSSAEYSTSNVPFKPAKALTISMGGLKEGDFTIVMGYPGGTTRYRESQSVVYNQNVRLPFLVRYLRASIKGLEAESEQDPEKKIKLQADIFSFTNSDKAFDGGVIAMRKAGIVGTKQAEEKRFETWVNADPARKAKYGEVLSSFARIYQEFDKNSQKNLTVNLMANSVPVFQVMGAIAGRTKPLAQEDKDRFKGALTEQMKDRNLIAETSMVKFFLREAAGLPEGQKIASVEAAFGNVSGSVRVKAEEDYVRALMDNKRYNTVDGLMEVYEMTPQQVADLKDPVLAGLVTEIPQSQMRGGKLNAEVGKWRELYLHGWSEMNNVKPYPDANSTVRFSYGKVRTYQPKESMTYSPFTTLRGVIEKDTGVEPFDVPQKLKDLYNTKDYGRYAGMGSVPVNFLTDNDIIGGNSGSPVLNAKGEQVGVVFDGNYEGLGNDFFYNDAVGRTLSVDIRYVFFVTEKFSGVNWFFPEIKMVDVPKN